jgi:hypothetical protein
VKPTNLPYGGAPLWQMRVAGRWPEDMVVVSLIGPQRIPNPQLWVGATLPDSAISGLEWRMLAGLDAEIIVNGKVPVSRVVATIRALLPHTLGLFASWLDAGITIPIKWLGTVARVHPPQYAAAEPSADDRALGSRIARRLRNQLRAAR